MRDADKTKSQLIEELMKMRVRVAELEGSDSDKNSEKLKDKAMPESAERLRMVLEATSDGIWDWDIKTGQAYFSPRYYTMLGYEPDEFPSNYDNWRRLIHPDDVKATEAVIQRALEEHNSFSVEFRMKNKNGDWIWILSRGRAFEMDNEGKLVRMAGSHTDISGSKQVEESLRLTQFILDNAPIGIWRIGTDSQILDVNQQGADSLGYSRDELRGMAIFDFDPEYSPEDWADGISMMKQTGPNTIETRHQSKNGHIFPVQVIKKLIQFGEKKYNIAFVQDITERRRNEESLRLTRFIFEKPPSASGE
jgi:PAS domain S-box-containing protein